MLIDSRFSVITENSPWFSFIASILLVLLTAYYAHESYVSNIERLREKRRNSIASVALSIISPLVVNVSSVRENLFIDKLFLEKKYRSLNLFSIQNFINNKQPLITPQNVQEIKIWNTIPYNCQMRPGYEILRIQDETFSKIRKTLKKEISKYEVQRENFERQHSLIFYQNPHIIQRFADYLNIEVEKKGIQLSNNEVLKIFAESFLIIYMKNRPILIKLNDIMLNFFVNHSFILFILQIKTKQNYQKEKTDSFLKLLAEKTIQWFENPDEIYEWVKYRNNFLDSTLEIEKYLTYIIDNWKDNYGFVDDEIIIPYIQTNIEPIY